MRGEEMTSTNKKAAVLVAGATFFALALPLTATPASGFFEFLFGGGARRMAPPSPLPQVRPQRGPSDGSEDYRGDRSGGGPSVAYCVRLCDGQPFPVQNSGGSASDMCSTMCPGAQTKVFNGSGLDHAVASDGKRYSALPTAFMYRKRQAPNCTCNGKTPYGVARLDVTKDPTLKPGDIVATNTGLATFRGMRGDQADLAPLDDKKLANVKVRPAPSAAALTARAEAPKTQRNEKEEDSGREKRRRSYR